MLSCPILRDFPYLLFVSLRLRARTHSGQSDALHRRTPKFQRGLSFGIETGLGRHAAGTYNPPPFSPGFPRQDFKDENQRWKHHGRTRKSGHSPCAAPALNNRSARCRSRLYRLRRGGFSSWPPHFCVPRLPPPPSRRFNCASSGAAVPNRNSERQWHGTISLDRGTLGLVRPLGTEADEPGSMWLDGNRIEIRPRSARSTDGVDILTTAPLDATLTVELSEAQKRDTTTTSKFILSELLDKPVDQGRSTSKATA